ncbi:MAG: DNA gyrase subunit A, partial [Clostridia bacterium]|nr:DNA gyrase subunit A [Clostridia bacterium]
MEVIKKENIITSDLDQVMHNSMLPYAEYVILDRALPRVEDGLKPVQRRIIYTMYEQGILPDKGYKKSARVVGDCLGKYHPHGDSSVYDAMVRLAQNFNMRMTLVDGQGNFGSVDGDPAAAMRYTEVKMRPLAVELIRDIEKNTVRWNPNFDDSLKEPDLLPAKFPNLLVNGASGIAVGLATNIPTHNLGEVIDGAIAYIENPKISLEELMKKVPGPDFPTGGFIISNGELLNAYKTGKGKFYIRAKLAIEKGDGDKLSIVISEIPYGVNKAKLLAKIDALTDEKKEIFGNIQSVNDESDRNGLRAVIKLKKEADVKKILNGLFKYSDLQVSYSKNIVAIARGKPKQLGLKEIFA